MTASPLVRLRRQEAEHHTQAVIELRTALDKLTLALTRVPGTVLDEHPTVLSLREQLHYAEHDRNAALSALIRLGAR